MEVFAKFVKGSQFRVESRGHQVICDQPLDNGGEDTGMTPPEFLLASLATCAGYYAAQYLKTRGMSAENLSVTVKAEKASQPARLGSFLIEVNVPPVEERHKEGILRSVKACVVHNTLLHAPAIEVALRSS
jgi:putative redox protein